MILKNFHFKKITSTNDKAIRLIKSGYNKGFISADRQTKGRGRQGKKWISMYGNLFITLFFEIDKNKSLSKITIYNLKIIKNALQKFTKRKLNIRSPNDILIGKKKICGILQETIFINNTKFLIVGIGINVIKNPNINNYPTSCLNNYSPNKIHKNKVSMYIKRAYEKKLYK